MSLLLLADQGTGDGEDFMKWKVCEHAEARVAVESSCWAGHAAEESRELACGAESGVSRMCEFGDLPPFIVGDVASWWA